MSHSNVHQDTPTSKDLISSSARSEGVPGELLSSPSSPGTSTCQVVFLWCQVMTVNWFKVQVYMGYILSSYKILMVEPPMTNSEAPSEVPSSLGSRGNGGKAPAGEA